MMAEGQIIEACIHKCCIVVLWYSNVTSVIFRSKEGTVQLRKRIYSFDELEMAK